MDKSENKIDLQELLFKQIKSKTQDNISIVDTISELLNISNDAVYRRLRCEKRLDFDELTKICSHYRISIDSLSGIKDNSLLFNYMPLDISDLNNYKAYIYGLSNNISNISKSTEKEILFSAVDIPMFHFMPYKELTFFKVFAWSNSISAFNGNFTKFCEQLNDEKLLKAYHQLAIDYCSIPSTEIWTEHTIDGILNLINYYYEIGCFISKDEALLLCTQLIGIFGQLNKWSENGYKNEHSPDTSNFKLYLSDIELENSFIVMKSNNNLSCALKLYTINSMATSNPEFCQETIKWINNARIKSTLISGASQKESYKFFNLMNRKIRYLIERIEKSQAFNSNSFIDFIAD